MPAGAGLASAFKERRQKLGQEAQVAEVTLVDDLPVIRLRDAVDFHRVGLVDEVEQHGKTLAETDASPISVTDVEHTLHFREEFVLVEKFGVLPSSPARAGSALRDCLRVHQP